MRISAVVLALAMLTVSCSSDDVDRSDAAPATSSVSTASPSTTAATVTIEAATTTAAPNTTEAPTTTAPVTTAPVTTEAPTTTGAPTTTETPLSDATIEGPITAGARGMPGTATPIDLEAAGYMEEEFFVSGEATAYRAADEFDLDGEWSVEEDTTASFTTRLLVRRPSDPAAFSGTVFVEWFNVSSNVDVDVDFGFASDEFLRSGDVWVGVSAQQIGITSTEGGDFGVDSLGLVAWDPERYGALVHPGDEFSYDIFTQAGRAVANPGDSELLSGYDVEQILAIGESQSAFRLLTYVNAVHPLADTYDGFLIHSRDGGGAPLVSGDGDQLSENSDDPVPALARVRGDLDVPVFQLVSETDLFSLRPNSPFPAVRQPDTDMVRTWEIAGTAHADAHYLAALYAQGTQNFDSFLDLTAVIPIANNGPQHWVVQAALRELAGWAAGTSVPPTAEPIATADGMIERDEFGNALGGIRTPHVDVPVATLTGEGASLIGSTTPLAPDVLADLYPTEADYLDAFSVALDRTIAAGFFLADDAAAILSEASLPE